LKAVKLVLSRENPRHRQCVDQTSVRPSDIFPYQHIELAGTRLEYALLILSFFVLPSNKMALN
jgi:hypothetical protein